MPRNTATQRRAVRNFGTSLNFPNSGNVQVTDSASLDLNGNFTFSAWINPRSFGGGNGRIFEKSGAYFFQINNVTNRFGLSTNGGASSFGSNVITLNIWQHIAATVNGTNVRFFYNGSFIGTGTVSVPTPNSNDLYIGNRSADDRAYDGLLDEVLIYNTNLSDSQITNLYNFGPDTVSPNLVGGWKFDEGSGSVAGDFSGNNNTGAITTATYSSDVVMVGRTVAGQRMVVRDFLTCLDFNPTGVSASSVWAVSKNNTSMGGWFKCANLGTTEQVIISNGAGSGGGSGGWSIVLNGNSSTNGSIQILRYFIAWTDTGARITDNNWHHVFMTIDATPTTKVFLDGIKVYTGTPTYGNAGVGSYVSSQGDGSRYFKGKIDDARFYNRELSESEVTNLYYGIETTPGPANSYKFDEGSGTSANDSGSSPKNGTISSATYSTDVVMVNRSPA